jgi:hypothetical protein
MSKFEWKELHGFRHDLLGWKDSVADGGLESKVGKRETCPS